MRKHELKFILVAAVLVRLVLLCSAWGAPHRLQTPDSRDYIELSDSLAETGEFQRDGRPEIFRTPGYPFFLLLGTALGESWWRVVLLLQILLDVLLVYLTFLLALMLCDRRAALWAAAFQAIAAVAITASLRVLSDSLFAVMLTLAICLLVHHLQVRKWWSLACAAASAAASCYLRPIGLLFCLVAVAVLLFVPGRLRRVGVFAGVVLLIIAPWVARNLIVADYCGFSSFASDSMYRYSAPAVLSAAQGRGVEEAREELAAEERLYRRSLGEGGQTVGKLARYRRKTAMKVIAAHLGTYAGIHLRSSTAFWLPGVTNLLEIAGVTTGQRGTLSVLHADGLLAATRHYLEGKMWALWFCAPALIVLAVKYALVLVCAVSRVRLRMGPAGWLVLLTILTAALAAGPAAVPRFRVPVEPLLSLAAGAAAARLLKRRTPWKGPEAKQANASAA